MLHRDKIIREMLEWLRGFGIPIEQYRVKLTPEEDEVPGRIHGCHLQMVRRTTKAEIHINDILFNDDGEVLEFGSPELKN